MEYCDLHCHSVYSDGTKTVKEILDIAMKENIKVLSITDHDRVKATREIINEKHFFNGIFVPGCEVTCVYNGLAIEVLVYGYDIDIFEKFIDKVTIKNEELTDVTRAYGLLKHFQKIDSNFSFDIHKATEYSLRHAQSKALFAKAIENEKIKDALLKENSSFSSWHNIFREGVNNPASKFYIDMSDVFPSIDQVVKEAHKANGIAVIAHPCLYAGDTFTLLKNIEGKLDGIECYHHANTGNVDKLVNFAHEHNKIITGGSDYHGYKNPLNNQSIPVEVFENFKDKLAVFFDLSKNNK